MKKHKIYLLIFLVAYAFAYYFFLRHLQIPPTIISMIPVIVAVIILSEERKAKSKVIKQYHSSKKNQNEIKND